MHLIQAIEIGPVKGKEGPCTVYLKNLPCQYEDFVFWFSESDWLLRSTTRLYLFPPESPCHCAPTMQALAEKLIADGSRHCKLRLQLAPKNQELAFGVRTDSTRSHNCQYLIESTEPCRRRAVILLPPILSVASSTTLTSHTVMHMSRMTCVVTAECCRIF